MRLEMMTGARTGALVLKEAMAARAAPATDMTIASTTRVLRSFMGQSVAKGLNQARDVDVYGCIYSGLVVIGYVRIGDWVPRSSC